MNNLLTLLLVPSMALLADETAPTMLLTACGPDQITFNVKSVSPEPELPTTDPGKALVVVIEEFYRPPKEIGKPTLRVGLDGSWVGANRDTSHLSFAVDPGAHHFCVDWQGAPGRLPPMAAAAGLTVAPGETYYFRARIMEHPGPYWTLDFNLVNNDEGQLLAARTPRSESTQKK